VKKIEIEHKNKFIKSKIVSHIDKCAEDFEEIRKLLNNIKVIIN
jgi:hypothetical protein